MNQIQATNTYINSHKVIYSQSQSYWMRYAQPQTVERFNKINKKKPHKELGRNKVLIFQETLVLRHNVMFQYYPVTRCRDPVTRILHGITIPYYVHFIGWARGCEYEINFAAAVKNGLICLDNRFLIFSLYILLSQLHSAGSWHGKNIIVD